MRGSAGLSGLLLGGVLLLGVALNTVLPTGSAGAAGAGTSTCAKIALTSFVFHPPSVRPGRSSTAVLTAQNCTGQTQDASVTWVGRYMGPGGDIPGGCPVIDPIARPLHLGPHRTVKSKLSYEVPQDCTATSLQVTASLQRDGKVRAHRTTSVVINGATT